MRKILHIAKPAKLGGRERFGGSRRRASGLLMMVAGLAIAFVQTAAGAQAAGPMNPAPLPAPPPQEARTIEVTGNGEAHVAPDVASLNLAIETHAATAQQSAGQNAALAEKVVDALNTKLQGKGKVWTGGYSLYPEYSDSSRPNDKPVVTGYRAENSITVETGEIGMLGGLIDTAIEAGANRINFLNFTLRDESQARGQAIALAAKDAQTQADALAKSLGVKLGPVVKATTVWENRPMPVMRMMAGVGASATMGAPTPVQPNEVTVPATVSITYQIQ
ncbi:MAG: SIMPL domain-containing protein [Candidatus Binataceae bacterium]